MAIPTEIGLGIIFLSFAAVVGLVIYFIISQRGPDPQEMYYQWLEEITRPKDE